jgi:HEAT repeat protein
VSDRTRPTEPRPASEPQPQERAGVLGRATAWLGRMWPPRRPDPDGRHGRGPKRAFLRSGSLQAGRHPPSNLRADHLAGDPAVAALEGALDHPDPEVRARAIVVIAEFADDRAARLLRARIHDASPIVRAAAAGAAARTKRLDVVATLIVARRDPDPAVRRAAAAAVSQATGRPIAASEHDAAIDAALVDELKAWWKQRRLAELTESAQGDP